MKLSTEVLREKVGSLGNNDDKSSENITKRINLHPFKLYCIYLDQLNLLNVGDLSRSWIWLYRGSKRERKICCQMFISCIKHCIRRFCMVLVQWTSKKGTKKHDACAEHYFAHKTNCFLMFSLSSSTWLLKLPHAWWLPLKRLSWLPSALVCGSLSFPGNTCSRLQDNRLFYRSWLIFHVSFTYASPILSESLEHASPGTFPKPFYWPWVWYMKMYML